MKKQVLINHSRIAESLEPPTLYFRVPKWKLAQYGGALEDKVKFSLSEEDTLAAAEADGTLEWVIFKAVPVTETFFTPTKSRKL